MSGLTDEQRQALAKIIDPEAFADHPIEQRSHVAALQWAARRHIAREHAERVLASGWADVQFKRGFYAGEQSADERLAAARAEGAERARAEVSGMSEPVSAWPYGTDAACRLIAAAGNPNERVENRDAWAVTMPHRPDVFAIEVARARERLEQAIAHIAAGGERDE